MHRFRRRDPTGGLRAVAEQLVGLHVDDARARVQAAGGVFHPIDQLSQPGWVRNRVNVRVENGVVVRVLSIG